MKKYGEGLHENIVSLAARPGAYDCPHGRALGFCPHGCDVPAVDYSGVLELLPEPAVGENTPSYGDYYGNKGRTK